MTFKTCYGYNAKSKSTSGTDDNVAFALLLLSAETTQFN